MVRGRWEIFFLAIRMPTKHGWTLNAGTGDPVDAGGQQQHPRHQQQCFRQHRSSACRHERIDQERLRARLRYLPLTTFTGSTTIGAGTLQLGDGTTRNGSVSGTITNNGLLVISNPNAQLFANASSPAPAGLPKDRQRRHVDVISSGRIPYQGGTHNQRTGFIAALATDTIAERPANHAAGRFNHLWR